MTALWRKYGKSITAAAAMVLTVVASALTDDRVDAAEAVQIATAVCAAILVWLVPNLPTHGWGAVKTVTNMALAALGTLSALLVGGVHGAEWVNIVLAAVSVFAVGAAPARSLPPPVVPPPLAFDDPGGV